MGECTAMEIIAASSRGLVLVIAALAGTLSIYLGWRLYKDSVLPKTSGEAAMTGMKFKLVAAGPGVFFVAFGMWLLVSLVNRPLALEEPVKVKALVPASPHLQLAQVRQDAKASDCPRCLVARRRLEFFDGGRDTTPAQVRDALDYAVAAIRDGSARYKEGDERMRAAADAVRTLTVLGRSIEQ